MSIYKICMCLFCPYPYGVKLFQVKKGDRSSECASLCRYNCDKCEEGAGSGVFPVPPPPSNGGNVGERDRE